MKHILITGGSGFTGRHVISELLSRGYRVSTLVREMSDLGVPCSSYCCDLTDRINLSEKIKAIKPDAIIHLAALSFVGHNSPIDFYLNNVIATENLLDAACQLDSLDKLIVSSSANVYGDQGIVPIAENAVPKPQNHYALSKYTMEQVCQNYFSKLPLLITRPFNYIGEGQSECFLVPKLVSHFKAKSEFIELGNIDVFRDFSDVNDIAKYYAELLECHINSEFVNLCSGKTYSLSNIHSMLTSITGHELQIRVNPEFVRAGEIKYLCGDRGRLEGVIGCGNSTQIIETLKRMVG